MVIRNRHTSLSFILVVMCISFFAMLIPLAQAQVTYTVNQEWVRAWINGDGSMDIKYNITLTYLSGSPQGIVTVGMPKGGFQIKYIQDLSNSSLQYNDVSQGNFYGIEVHLKSPPVPLDKPNTFTVYAIVPGMVSPDKTNPGNVGMLFYPTTFPTASGSIRDLRVAITLPQGVQSNEVKYPTGVPFDNVYMDGNNLVVYWERRNWSPSQAFTAGVSFPEKYVSLAPSGPSIWYYAGIGAFVLVVIASAIVSFTRFRKAVYARPRLSVEALGAARGLTAVEAGVVLSLKPVRVLTMILFGLLLKRIVMVTTTDPLIKLKRLEVPAGQPSPTLRYYEIDYLKAIEPDGTLNEMMLARTYLGLTDTVNRKLRGYSREDTINYYRSIVNQAWTQVTQAGTPELKGDALDQNIEWLLADERFNERFKTAFPPDIIIFPRPGWPTTTPEAKPIPGQDFANNVVRSLEKMSNNLVKNVQEFTNRLIPAQAAAASERSVRGQSSCVCACAACACACACVSCACACAGGGAR